MKIIISLILIFTSALFGQTKKEVSKHEKHVQDLISAIKKINQTLEKVKDEATAKENIDSLKKLQVEIQVLKAQQKVIGQPPQDLKEKIVNQYAKSIFTEAQTLNEHLKRIHSAPKLFSLLKDIIKDFKP